MNTANEKLSIALTGDSIISRPISVHKDEKTIALYNKIKEADVAFTNLEVLPNDFTGYPAARSDGAHFAAHSYVMDDLKELGINLYSCANNHALDYGVEGLLSSMAELDKRSLSYAGVGRNLTEARMPVYHTTSEGTVAMIACTSTFFEEQAAGEERPEVQGRPGVNPLRFDVEYEVTEEQMKSLKEIYEDLGLEAHRREFIHLGFGSEPEDSEILPFTDSNLRVAGTLNANFRTANSAKVRTKPNEKDMKDICKWVKEAKSRADVVIVSLHAHEQGESREHPAEFIREFAHTIIDAGADMIVGHGPHLLRGLEIYNEKPIFYSLGNFIGHNELIYKLPYDSYNRFKVDPSLTPSEVFHLRSDGGKRGFPGNDIYWKSIMPVCHFEAGKLSSIEIFPVSLTKGDVPFKRGRPYLSEKEAGKKILESFSELSTEFGTIMKIDDSGKAIVNLSSKIPSSI
ncbi:CapA family protein [Sporosarcina siberiensis]|uniref:CapA family protein n=1 Tax=Sporosarcina siberiensis TaxID=1365606 RepID=A0ABW4SJK7_9BACL